MSLCVGRFVLGECFGEPDPKNSDSVRSLLGRFLRRNQMKPNKALRPTTPPTVPPAIAPAWLSLACLIGSGVEDNVEDGVEVGVSVGFVGVTDGAEGEMVRLSEADDPTGPVDDTDCSD